MIVRPLIRNLAFIPLWGGITSVLAAESTVHDAEHYILDAQHGEKWAAED